MRKPVKCFKIRPHVPEHTLFMSSSHKQRTGLSIVERPCNIVLVPPAYCPSAELGNTSSVTTTPSPTAAGETSGLPMPSALCKMKCEGTLRREVFQWLLSPRAIGTQLGFEITTATILGAFTTSGIVLGAYTYFLFISVPLYWKSTKAHLRS